MAKSGSGKSTIINSLVEENSKLYHQVKSFTTRAPREYDENDLLTHVFLPPETKVPNNALAVYEDKINRYQSWVTPRSFMGNKINLYAIDPVAYINFYKKYNVLYDIVGVYLFVDEEVRKQRFLQRGSKTFQEEEHLSLENLKHVFIPYHVLDISNKDIKTSLEELKALIHQ